MIGFVRELQHISKPISGIAKCGNHLTHRSSIAGQVNASSSQRGSARGELNTRVAGAAGTPGDCETAVAAELVNNNDMSFDSTGGNDVCGSTMATVLYRSLERPIRLIACRFNSNLFFLCADFDV